MSNHSESRLKARSIHLPVGRVLAGLGAALVLAAPGAALAQGKLCPVTISVTSNETLGALQLGVDYAAASALGDVLDCTIAPAGLNDVEVDEGADEVVLGYASTTGFTGPTLFATCYFKVNNAADPAPTAGNFAVSVQDASDTDVPPNPESPTTGVSVGDCVPSGSCSNAPATGCKTSVTTGKSKLLFKDNADNTKDQGQYQWKAGAATLLSEFADPTTAGETWSWCVYEGGSLVRGSDVPSAGTCAGKPCWKAAGTKGFGFKGDVAGVSQIKVKAGDAGKALVQVKAKSKAGNFSSPALPLSGPVVSQLVIDDGMTTTCFQSTFTAPAKNDAAMYSSKD